MRRYLWLSVFILAVSTGCSDSLVGPVKGSATWTLTFVEPTEPGTCCPTPCTGGSTQCAGNCSSSSCCPSSHCDKNGRPK
jgi:hypothetical protein